MLITGTIVRSAAGHDKDKFHCVVAVEGNCVKIADGKTRKLEKPKSKNPIHVRPTNTVLNPAAYATDKKLRQALAAFSAGQNEEGG